MLTTLGQQVEAVESAPDALEALGRARFDLMITDLSMPAMDGLTLAAEVRRLYPWMAIALSTGYGQTTPGGAPDPALIDAMVNKPFKLSDLENTLFTLYAGLDNK